MVGAIGWAVVGTGMAANNAVAPAISAAKEAELIAVVSRDEGTATQFAAKHGAKRSYTNYDDMLRDNEVDVVYIATPNALHADQAVAAARAGKHVLCEKPLALSVTDAQRVVDECASAGVKLGTNFQTRHHEALAEAKKIIAEGRIGDVKLAQMEVGIGAIPLGGWRTDPGLAGLGAIYNVGVHAYDLLRYLLDTEVVEVTAMSDAVEDDGLETAALTLLRFRSGALAYVNANQVVNHYQPDIHLYGTAGRIVGSRCTRPFLDGELRVTTEGGEESTEFTSRNAFERAVSSFNRTILDDTEPNASGSDGLESVRVIEAITRSLREGVRVEVSYDDPASTPEV